MSGGRKLAVRDLPTRWQIALMITQNVLGFLLGMVLGRVIRRVFLAAYATVDRPRQ